MDTKEKLQLLKSVLQNFNETDFEAMDANLLGFDIPIDYQSLKERVRREYKLSNTDITIGSKVMLTTGYPSFKVGYVRHISIHDRCTIENENDSRISEFRYKTELILLKI